VAINREALTAEAVDLVVSIVSPILTEEQDPSWLNRLDELTDTEQQNFLRAMASHRIAEILVSSPYFPLLPSGVAEAIQRRTQQATKKVLVLAHQTREVYELMSQAEIPCLIYKGIPLALVSTGRLNSRGPGDVDLLVSPDNVDRAHRLLHENGWAAGFGTIPGRGVAWKFYSWLNREPPYSRAESHVDLHWRVSQEVRLFPDAAELISRGSILNIGATEIRTLSREDALLAACYHFYHDGCHSLRALIDVYRLSGIVGVTSAGVVPPALQRLEDDVVEFARDLLGPRSESTSSGTKAGRIALLWKRNSRMVNEADERRTVPLGELQAAFNLHVGLGNSAMNLVQYSAARLFDFNNLDLSRGWPVLFHAFFAELSFQWEHRVLRRKLPNALKEGSVL
jgi:hypothetical protein